VSVFLNLNSEIEQVVLVLLLVLVLEKSRYLSSANATKWCEKIRVLFRRTIPTDRARARARARFLTSESGLNDENEGWSAGIYSLIVRKMFFNRLNLPAASGRR
jgi:hypothetical protein